MSVGPILTGLVLFLLLQVVAPQPWSAQAAEAPGEKASVNLALGRPYSVSAEVQDTHFIGLETKQYPDSGGKELTDGKKGRATYSDQAWQGHIRRGLRTVAIDLGAVQTVERANVRFLQNGDSGILFPRQVEFSLSLDNQAWTKPVAVPSSIPLSARGSRVQEFAWNTEPTYARYVRVQFLPDIWAFLDEIEVWGKAGEQPQGRAPQAIEQPAPVPKGYPKPGSQQAGGARHIVLTYTGYYQDPSVTTWDPSDYAPYVVYIDREYQVKDWFFDTFLMLPLGTASSGRSYVGEKEKPSNQADWQEFADKLFEQEHQLAALNEAVRIQKERLNDPSYRAKVILTTVYPSPFQKAFGDVDGDGKVENLDPRSVGSEVSLRNRVAVARWFLNQLLQRWKDARYEHLELIGFYWLPEAVMHQNSEEEEAVVMETSRLIHEAGYRFLWIPFVQSDGYRDWERLGFDVAMMQPNYAFNEVDKSRLDQTAVLAKQYGLGLEVEKHWDSDERRLQQYSEYLDAGARTGFMSESVVGYYQGVKDFGAAAFSSYEGLRELYDNTYRFVKGIYKDQPAGSQ